MRRLLLAIFLILPSFALADEIYVLQSSTSAGQHLVVPAPATVVGLYAQGGPAKGSVILLDGNNPTDIRQVTFYTPTSAGVSYNIPSPGIEIRNRLVIELNNANDVVVQVK